MRFGLNDLKKFLHTNASPEDIAKALTSLGLEVEKITMRTDLAPFVVASIVSTSPHPNADRLKICIVDDGSPESKTIVCGASNAKGGMKVVLAPIGAKIPNGEFIIKQSKIRDQLSFGMLCSFNELNLEGDSDGIIELEKDAQVGQSFASYAGLDDAIFEISITPNRADCLSIMGIARDLAATNIGKFIHPEKPTITFDNKIEAAIKIEITNQNIASQFIAIEIENVTNKESPAWLKNALTKAGMKPISLLVDIGNYIAHNYGQPLHIYDRDKISEKLSITLAQNSENFTGLNDKTYVLSDNDIIVRDKNAAQCIAGILGSSASGCSISTTNILIEAANFNKINIAKTGRMLKIDSDARYKFERGVDESLANEAIMQAASLIIELCGGNILKPTVIKTNELPKKYIEMPADFVGNKLGAHIEVDLITQILMSLGFEVTIKQNILEVCVPSWRQDISIAEDLVAEIARIYGYDKIAPLALQAPQSNYSYMLNARQRISIDSRHIMAANGYHEVIAWSFASSKDCSKFSALHDELFLQNPLTSELDYMRPSALVNMLKILENNVARSVFSMAMFEVGPIFSKAELKTIETECISAIKYGYKDYKSWQSQDREYNFFDIKADVAYLLEEFNIDIDKCVITRNAPCYYHPTKSALIKLDDNIIGYFGQIHPNLAQDYNLKLDSFAFEIFPDNFPIALSKHGKKTNLSLSNYPVVTKDLAFILDKNCNVGNIINDIKLIDAALIKKVQLFDLYEGDKVAEGLKSIAFTYWMQSQEATLTNEQIHELMNKIIDFMMKKYNATLRRDA